MRTDLMTDRRVVVTGLGAVTPLGANVSDYWDGLISGRSGIATVTHFDASQFDVQFGGHCDKFDPRQRIDPRAAKRMDRFAQLAYAAAMEAHEQSGLRPEDVPPERGAVMLGTGIGGISEFEEQFIRLREKGPSRVSAFTIPKLMANAVAGHISIALNFQAGGFTVSTACASAGSAMIEAYHSIRRGEVDVVITGGSEAALTPLGLAAFAAMKALSTRNDEPARASRPFDKDRDGFVLGEGAGILIFEDLECAKRRGAEILCEVIGCGASSDACDMVQPEPEGRGAAKAMSDAIRSAGINPEDIDYINAHGT
ncbi:MAG: beta-ketoacyl-ACP synthase II, partial [Planctomycetota bacterium]